MTALDNGRVYKITSSGTFKFRNTSGDYTTYDVYNLHTNLRIATYDAEENTYRFAADVSFQPSDLVELMNVSKGLNNVYGWGIGGDKM